MQKLREENDRLSAKLSELAGSASTRGQQQDETEAQLREQVKALKKEGLAAGREVRELRAELAGLQAKSPEVITEMSYISNKYASTR